MLRVVVVAAAWVQVEVIPIKGLFVSVKIRKHLST